MLRPLAASFVLTTVTNGPRFSTTLPLLVVMAALLPPWPDSAFTSWACTLRFSCTHRLATCWLLTILATWVWMKPCTALASEPENECSKVPTRVKPLLVRVSAAWLVSVWMGRCASICALILFVSAAWMAGSWISGLTFSTYRLVSETWFAVHIPITEIGARMQPSTMSTAATGVRQLTRWRWGGAGGAGWLRSSKTSVRSRSSSSRSSPVRPVLVGVMPSGVLPPALPPTSDTRSPPSDRGQACRRWAPVPPGCGCPSAAG